MESENMNKINEINNGSGIRGFAEEFFKFGFEFTARNGDLKLSPEELVTLYAIYKKELRAKSARDGNSYVNSGYGKKNTNEPATPKQINAIKYLMKKGKIQVDSGTNVDSLTKREASEIIGKAGDGKSPSLLFCTKQSEIPMLYETENIPVENKVIYQKWEIKDINFYWLIAEYDEKQELAFGYANLNSDDFAEWGYISIKELRDNGAEMDKEWKPTKFKEVMKSIRQEALAK